MFRAYRCPKHVELFMIISKIFASSWYLSSFSYMMYGHTYIKNAPILLCFSTTVQPSGVALKKTSILQWTEYIHVKNNFKCEMNLLQIKKVKVFLPRLHLFFTSALDCDEWSTLSPGRDPSTN